jgi:hypothetical protein
MCEHPCRCATALIVMLSRTSKPVQSTQFYQPLPYIRACVVPMIAVAAAPDSLVELISTFY